MEPKARTSQGMITYAELSAIKVEPLFLGGDRGVEEEMNI